MSNDGNQQLSRPGPPPTTGSAPVRRLVRDPQTRLGGVASGLAHYLGIDVSLVRLAFVLTTLFSGAGLIVYLLAWLVVPKAEQWPPLDAPTPGRSITSREAGIGLAILGLLVVLFVNGGSTAQVVVPVLLVAGGVWLLRQPEIVASPRPRCRSRGRHVGGRRGRPDGLVAARGDGRRDRRTGPVPGRDDGPGRAGPARQPVQLPDGRPAGRHRHPGSGRLWPGHLHSGRHGGRRGGRRCRGPDRPDRGLPDVPLRSGVGCRSPRPTRSHRQPPPPGVGAAGVGCWPP